MRGMQPASGRGYQLRRARVAARLTQKELAALAACSATSVSRIELGQAPMSSELWANLGAALRRVLPGWEDDDEAPVSPSGDIGVPGGLGAEVRRRRMAAGLSIAELGRAAALPPPTIKSIERGVSAGDLATVEALEGVLGPF